MLTNLPRAGSSEVITLAFMAKPDRENMRLHSLVAQGQIAHVLHPGQVPTPQALPVKAASAIFGELARFGFSTFQQVPGGAQLISTDGKTNVIITASGWAFQQTMAGSPGFRPAVDQLGVILRELLVKLDPPVWVVNQTVDISANWPLGSSAERYIIDRYLTKAAVDLAESLDLTFNGGAVRLNMGRDSPVPIPPGLENAVAKAIEEFDIRIEPFFQDKSHLWLQVTGRMAVPTNDVQVMTGRLEYAHRLLWEEIPRRLSFESD